MCVFVCVQNTSGRFHAIKDFRLRRVRRGAYGTAQVLALRIRHEEAEQVDLFKRAESAFYWEEREIMATADLRWSASFTTLPSSFSFSFCLTVLFPLLPAPLLCLRLPR